MTGPTSRGSASTGVAPSAPCRVLCVIGTRPEAVKMAPIVLELQRDPRAFELTVMATGQHRDLLDQALDVFSITPDIDLDIMTDKQSLTDVTCAVLGRMEEYLAKLRPDVVLAQGDTTTVTAAAIACFYAGVRFGHVEAGLRTGDIQSPYPEEFNRKVAGIVAAHHFAPTEPAAANLIREGVPQERIVVTGNSVIDALFYILNNTEAPATPLPAGAPYILMTCHRREVFGNPIRQIFGAVREFAEGNPDTYVWYPVHPNPNVKGPAHEILGGLTNVVLSEPLDYINFVHAMNGAHVILSDSGGVQEEAPSLGKPVLVLRDVTERPEAVAAGTCVLVGPHRLRILSWLKRLFEDPGEWREMSEKRNPFGDGTAAERTVAALREAHERRRCAS